MINTAIKQLVDYAIRVDLIEEDDRYLATNRLLEVLCLYEYSEPKECATKELHEILHILTDDAYQRGLLPQNTTSCRDLFDTKLMGCLTPLSSQINKRFFELYQHSPQDATDYYYKFSQNTNYIRRDRTKKDKRWKVETPYGWMDITINLAKPEKDPADIIAAGKAPQSGYPTCLLCAQNEGFAGHANHPARQNHRIIPLMLQQQPWFLQYSPYVYYNEHCIVLNAQHIPMKIEKATFSKLLDFVQQYPHYFIGSNADLPIVGGSILSHDHFQGGRYCFAMENAPIETALQFAGYTDVQAGIVAWPLSVLRLRSKQSNQLVELANDILDSWRNYTDESAFVFAKTNGIPHNTITPIARKKGNWFELDLVLRNNITTEEHPMGVFHPHQNLHHIKKENIGLIEVMGLAVLPSRLAIEMDLLADAILSNADIRQDERIAMHADWALQTIAKNPALSPTTIDAIIQNEIGKVFCQVLEDAGVFKRTEQGKFAFLRFTKSLDAVQLLK